MPGIRPPRFEGTIELGGRRRLGYAEYGPSTGRPLLWFHGTPGARRQIPPRARELAMERHIRLVAVERPGIGASTPHAYRSLVEWAADIETLCDALELSSFAVAGLSGGGPYALACAHEMPERVVAVALLGGVAPSVGDDAAPGGLTRYASAMSGLVRLSRRPLGAVLPRLVSALEPVGQNAIDLFSSFMPPGDQRVFADPDIREMFLDDIMLGARDQMQAFLLDAALFGRHWGFSVEDIRTPVHMWYGDADIIVPVTHGEHLARLIPNAKLRIRPEEGHLGGLHATEEVFEAILAHLDDAPREVAERT